MSSLLPPLAKSVVDAARVYSPRRLPWHLLAIGLTYAIVTSGLGWQVAETFRDTPIQRLAFTAGRIGLWTPVVVPLAMFVAGVARRDARTWRNG